MNPWARVLGAFVAVVVEPVAFLLPSNAAAPGERFTSGDGAFDERFAVRCDGQAFARELLDDDVRAWFMTADDEWGFELSAGVALAYRPIEAWTGATAAIEAVTDLAERIPAGVRERHPLPAAEAPPLPGVRTFRRLGR